MNRFPVRHHRVCFALHLSVNYNDSIEFSLFVRDGWATAGFTDPSRLTSFTSRFGCAHAQDRGRATGEVARSWGARPGRTTRPTRSPRICATRALPCRSRGGESAAQGLGRTKRGGGRLKSHKQMSLREPCTLPSVGEPIGGRLVSACGSTRRSLRAHRTHDARPRPRAPVCWPRLPAPPLHCGNASLVFSEPQARWALVGPGMQRGWGAWEYRRDRARTGQGPLAALTRGPERRGYPTTTPATYATPRPRSRPASASCSPGRQHCTAR